MRDLPVLHVHGRSLAEAYEAALLALHEHGIPLRTQYDRPEDPPSLDCTMDLTVLEPLAEPMVHKAFPGGIDVRRESGYSRFRNPVTRRPSRTSARRRVPPPHLRRPAAIRVVTFQACLAWREIRHGQAARTGKRLRRRLHPAS